MAFLTDASLISQQELASILQALPTETALHAPIPLQTTPISARLASTSLNQENAEKQQQQSYYTPVPTPAPQEKEKQQPPPAYPTAPAPPPAALTYASAIYAYIPTDAGDLALSPNDRIAVVEYMNAEWWKGRSERTGQEGIFPRSYVRIDDKIPKDSAPTSYGNMPLDITQAGSTQTPSQPGKGQEMGKKFGKKLGNAAIFGAGASIGGNIVNSIF